MLLNVQLPGAQFVAPPSRWLRQYHQRIKPGAQPLVILQPGGPVMFVFDVSQTEPDGDAPPLPIEVVQPFEPRAGFVDKELDLTIENAKRDGVRFSRQRAGSQSAGSIGHAAPGARQQMLVKGPPNPEYVELPVRYDLLVNETLSAEATYATIVHELGHLYCGHLGTPTKTWWPDRQKLARNISEFEAESICYVVCSRLGIKNPSAEYLAGYVQNQPTLPEISLECVMKAAGLIEQMGRTRLRPRREGQG